MLTSNFFLAVSAYILFNFAFAMLWNMVIFKKVYDKLTRGIAREKPIIPLGLLAIIVQGLSLAILFVLFFDGNNPVGTGLMFGLLIGSYSIAYGAFVVPAKFTVKPIRQYALLELIYGVLHFGIAGIIMALIFAA